MTKTKDEVVESVSNEQNELNEKIARLGEFLGDKKQSGNLSTDYYWAMVNQHRAMEIYSSMLKSRIELLKANAHVCPRVHIVNPPKPWSCD